MYTAGQAVCNKRRHYVKKAVASVVGEKKSVLEGDRIERIIGELRAFRYAGGPRRVDNCGGLPSSVRGGREAPRIIAPRNK